MEFRDRRPPTERKDLPALTATERVLGKQDPADRHANPENIRTAYGYHQWLEGRPSRSMDQLAYAGMLSNEEGKRGYTSFPPDHPMNPQNLRRTMAKIGATSVRRQKVREYMARPPTEPPVKRNVFETTCSSCGNKLRAGEGVIARTSQGIKVVHPHEL